MFTLSQVIHYKSLAEDSAPFSAESEESTQSTEETLEKRNAILRKYSILQLN